MHREHLGPLRSDRVVRRLNAREITGALGHRGAHPTLPGDHGEERHGGRGGAAGRPRYRQRRLALIVPERLDKVRPFSRGGFLSGQRGRAVNPLAYAFAGSNPAPPIFSAPFGSPNRFLERSVRPSGPTLAFVRRAVWAPLDAFRAGARFREAGAVGSVWSGVGGIGSGGVVGGSRDSDA